MIKEAKPAGKTSEAVSKAGVYTPECCNVERFFEKGATFQRCPRCQRLTDWELVMIEHQKAA
jgi:hypothetical protein